MAHTIYRRPTAGGAGRQICGFAYPAGASFSIPQRLFKDAGIGPPKVGDRVRAADGAWGTVSSFDLSEGVYTVGVTPDPEPEPEEGA